VPPNLHVKGSCLTLTGPRRQIARRDMVLQLKFDLHARCKLDWLRGRDVCGQRADNRKNGGNYPRQYLG